MAKTPSAPARILVFLAAVLLGGVVFWSVLKNTKGHQGSAPAATSPAADPKSLAKGGPPASDTKAGLPDAPVAKPAAESAAPASNPQVPSAPAGAAAQKLIALKQEASATPPATLGSLDKASPKLLEAEFSLRGAGLHSVKLAHHFTSIRRDVNVEMQHERAMPSGVVFTPMSLLGVQIDASYVSLADASSWREIGPGDFEATILDEATGTPVGKVHRKYEVADASYIIRVAQDFTNLSAQPRVIRWFQIGPLELPADPVTYGGDKRRVRFGYLVDASSDPSRQIVLADDSTFLLDRSHVIGGAQPSTSTPLDMPLWPTTRSTERKYELVWAAATNRYFAAVSVPLLPTPSPAGPIVKAMPNVDSVDRLFAYDTGGGAVALRFNGSSISVPAGGKADLSQGFFTGPMSAREINGDALGKNAGLDGLVLFNFGGMCGCCTFAWLTQPLLSLLTLLHSITGDWAVGIICLVVIVKSVLHPITRWSQIRLQRFGKQMQAMGPKMQKIKDKYKDDPTQLQAETAKLWKEEGVNPAGALGCLPMFLQTPVWMALSATLFFAIELRHQGAFYGVFQSLASPGNVVWFLGDLAEPDRLWYFPQAAFKIPVISGLMGPITSLNIMPMLLGIVFFIQQKYMTPPTTTPQTPEQEMQMKMMKWMTIFMFPIMMYNAPSGLTFYFFANTTLGILESKWIKRHIETHGLLDLDKIREEKAKKKGEGFFARLQRMAQEQQQARQVAARQGEKDPGRHVRKKL